MSIRNDGSIIPRRIWYQKGMATRCPGCNKYMPIAAFGSNEQKRRVTDMYQCKKCLHQVLRSRDSKVCEWLHADDIRAAKDWAQKQSFAARQREKDVYARLKGMVERGEIPTDISDGVAAMAGRVSRAGIRRSVEENGEDEKEENSA